MTPGPAAIGFREVFAMENDTQGAEGKAARILVVDDEPAVRQVLTRVLRMAGGYEVEGAGDGETARTILRDHCVDVVITDLLMPDLSGLELMQWSREHHPGPTWIILSGRGTFDDAVKAVRLGAFDYIPKPLVSMDSMLISVRNALHQRRLAEDRRRLHRDLENRNARLARQVEQFREACRLLCEQAETIDTDLRRAELIQRALLPREAPSADGMVIDAVYRPSLNVGGDLYDVVRIGENHLVAYVADAAGHGVSAAMLAVLLKHRMAMMDHDYRPSSPATALAAANASLRNECAAPGLFVTAVYCLLDLESHRLTVASAGHPPAILCRADGRIERIHHTGPALGLTSEAAFAEKSVQFGPGDRLLLYTDGLFHASLPDEALDSEKIARELAEGDRSGPALLHHLLALAARSRGEARRQDDITMLLLQSKQGVSHLDNGRPTRVAAAPATSRDETSDVQIGVDGRGATVRIAGRGGWTHSAAFREACVAEIEAGRALRLDLALCTYLDSTFLGTIQEVVDRAAVRRIDVAIHGMLPDTRALFTELGMDRVLQRICPQARPLPDRMDPIHPRGTDDSCGSLQVLRAHQALASLSDDNRREFAGLIEALQAELGDDDGEAVSP